MVGWWGFVFVLWFSRFSIRLRRSFPLHFLWAKIISDANARRSTPENPRATSMGSRKIWTTWNIIIRLRSNALVEEGKCKSSNGSGLCWSGQVLSGCWAGWWISLFWVGSGSATIQLCGKYHRCISLLNPIHINHFCLEIITATLSRHQNILLDSPTATKYPTMSW